MKPWEAEKEAAALKRLAGKRRRTKGEIVVVPESTEARFIARDVMALVAATVRDLGGEVTVTVRALLVQWARRASVASFFDAKADEAGLSSEAGQRLSHLASLHQQASQRALSRALIANGLLKGDDRPGRGLERLRAKVKGV